MALLCTVPLDELKREIDDTKEKQKKIISEEIELETYRKHNLYSEKKATLAEKCKKIGIPFKMQKKHELVKSLTKETVEEYSPKSIENVAGSLNEINKLPVTDLRCILQKDDFPTIGTKDALALCVFLLRSHKEDFISGTEVDYLLKIIVCAEDVTKAEKRLSLLGIQDSIEKRKFFTNSRKSILKKLQPMTETEEIFKPLAKKKKKSSKSCPETTNSDENQCRR